jgi:hypothetical protein
MSFDPCNCFQNIHESIGTPTPKVGAHLGVVWVHFLTPSYNHGSMKCDSWASLSARTFTSPCLGRAPKARVATWYMMEKQIWTEKHYNKKIYQQIIKDLVFKTPYLGHFLLDWYIFPLNMYVKKLFRWVAFPMNFTN